MKILTHKFVDLMPATLDADVIYVSIEYGTACHLCCCGCGLKVVTPLTPTDWKLIYDGESITLYPSIGCWGHPCKSHYWITNNRVEWAGKLSAKRIASKQAADMREKLRYYSGGDAQLPTPEDPDDPVPPKKKRFLSQLRLRRD
jgi:uncharacterized protein DUF6527